jgi:hypothetical protein
MSAGILLHLSHHGDANVWLFRRYLEEMKKEFAGKKSKSELFYFCEHRIRKEFITL